MTSFLIFSRIFKDKAFQTEISVMGCAVWVAILAFALVGSAFCAADAPKPIHPNEVKTLVFRPNEFAAGIRTRGVPRMKQVGDLGVKASPSEIVCTNVGLDDEREVIWRCEATMDGARLGRTEISWESYPKDAETVLPGSASLEYELISVAPKQPQPGSCFNGRCVPPEIPMAAPNVRCCKNGMCKNDEVICSPFANGEKSVPFTPPAPAPTAEKKENSGSVVGFVLGMLAVGLFFFAMIVFLCVSAVDAVTKSDRNHSSGSPPVNPLFSAGSEPSPPSSPSPPHEPQSQPPRRDSTPTHRRAPSSSPTYSTQSFQVASKHAPEIAYDALPQKSYAAPAPAPAPVDDTWTGSRTLDNILVSGITSAAISSMMTPKPAPARVETVVVREKPCENNVSDVGLGSRLGAAIYSASKSAPSTAITSVSHAKSKRR